MCSLLFPQRLGIFKKHTCQCRHITSRSHFAFSLRGNPLQHETDRPLRKKARHHHVPGALDLEAAPLAAYSSLTPRTIPIGKGPSRFLRCGTADGGSPGRRLRWASPVDPLTGLPWFDPAHSPGLLGPSIPALWFAFFPVVSGRIEDRAPPFKDV